MFLGLRLTKGVSGAEFHQQFGQNMWNVYGQVIEEMEKNGLILRESVASDARLKSLIPTEKAVRLDAQLGNGPLNAWYARQGYLSQGTMREGSYEGILREKLLKNRSC